MFCHILVYKLFSSHRWDLPLASDCVLMTPSPFYHRQKSFYSSPFQRWPENLNNFVWEGLGFAMTTIQHTRSNSAIAAVKDHARQAAVRTALERLIEWDTSAKLKHPRKHEQDQLFRDSLSNDELMLDLSIASKLDAVLKMIADQMQTCDHPDTQVTTGSNHDDHHNHDNDPEDGHEDGDDHGTPLTKYFSPPLQVYADRALVQYARCLYGYFQAAWDEPSYVPPGPELDFTIQRFFPMES
jgi:hypothetical protein